MESTIVKLQSCSREETREGRRRPAPPVPVSYLVLMAGLLVLVGGAPVVD